MIKWKIILVVLVLIVVTQFAFIDELTIKEYELQTNKVEDSFRIALITDLHCSEYGEGQKELLDALAAAQPAVVLFGGDIADGDLPLDNMIELIVAVAKEYNCYYVFGNHENRRGDREVIKQILSSNGITLLEGQCILLRLNDQEVNLCGVDDFSFGKDVFENQLENAIDESIAGNYTILLVHRPEKIDYYLKYDFDLVLAGHTHGGQWRIPLILNGFVAPDQGIFPKYGGGKYLFGDTTMIVSRGLARDYTHIPRIFNPPELVFVDIVPVH